MRAFRGVACLLLLIACACGDPTEVMLRPEARELTVLMILDPGEEVQPALLVPLGTDSIVSGLAGTLSEEGGVVASASAADPWATDELYPCIRGRYGTIDGRGGHPRCLAFEFVPEHGRSYTVRFEAEGRPTAIASTRIPGDFSITSVDARGTPPGTEGLEVTWRKSAGAYRYVVGLRPATPPSDCDCLGDVDRQGWVAVTSDTTLSTIVGPSVAEELEGAKGPWYIDVYAMDEHLYEHLTTGTPDEYFPVPPVHNVENGYGVVGAWVRRSIRVTASPEGG